MKFLLLLAITLGALTAHASEYTVPVDDPALKPFARFEVEDYTVRYVNDQLQLSFSLPPHLMGTEMPIHFLGPKGDRQPTRLFGDGQMNCAEDHCSVKYAGVNIDVKKRNAFLRSISGSSAEYSARIRVAELFRADPSGILILDR